MPATLGQVGDFLGRKRLAMVGVSRSRRDFTRMLMRELLRRGYDVVPVNPGAAELEGRPCYPRVGNVPEPVDWALLVTPAARTADAVLDCAEAGVRRVWIHRGAGPGAVSAEAVARCQELGLEAVVGLCPLGFLPDTGLIHRVHTWFVKRDRTRIAAS